MFRDIDPLWRETRFMSAVCFLMSAAALACLQDGVALRWKTILARLFSIAVSIIGLLMVFGYQSAIHPGWIGGRDLLLNLHLAPASRMAFITAAFFSLYGGLLFLLGTRLRQAANICHGALLPIIVTSYLVIVGYLFNISVFYEWRNLGVVPSLPTAVSFFALCSATYCTNPGTWLMSVFAGADAGAFMARRLLPALLIIPLLIGWLHLYGERAGIFGSEIDVVWVVFAHTFSLLSLLWLNARSVKRTDLARRVAEAKLQTSKDFIETTLNAINDSLAVIDTANFNILGANKAFRETYNLHPETTINKSCYELTHNRSTPCLPPDDVCPLVQTLNTGKPSTVEHIHSDGDGGNKYFEISVFPIRNEAGEIKQIVHLARDITERKRMILENRQQREELSHVSRLATIGEFAASIAHEIHQPLTAILNNAQAAKRFLSADPVDTDEVHDALADIINSVRHAGEVIHNLRSFVKRKDVEKASLDINGVIKDVLMLLQGEISDRNIPINLTLHPDILDTFGSRIELQQVLINLILNACDAMLNTEPQQRGLSIRTTMDDPGCILVAVRDSGPGLAENDLERVFDNLYTTKPEGLGMGLSISKTIILDHGGRLWAANNLEGGATFYFTLPANKG